MSILTFKREEVIKVLDTAESDTAPVFLAADRGVYLMSRTQPKGGHIAYAANLSPEDEGWWDRKVQRVGGDDFGEKIGDVAQWRGFLADSIGSIKLRLSATKISVVTQHGN